MVQQNQSPRAEPERNDVAELAGTPGQKIEEVGELVDVATEEAAARSGRRRTAGHGGSGQRCHVNLLAIGTEHVDTVVKGSPEPRRLAATIVTTGKTITNVSRCNEEVRRFFSTGGARQQRWSHRLRLGGQ